MTYKAKYTPSDLLCPERYTWHELSKCVPLLDKNKYVVFSDTIPPVDDDRRDVEKIEDPEKHWSEAAEASLPTVPLLLQDQLTQYGMLAKRSQEQLHESIHELCTLTGPDLSQRLVVTNFN